MQEPIITDASKIEWKDMPNSQTKFAILAGDPDKEEFFVLRVKFPPNFDMTPHYHLNYEYDTLIEGTCYIGVGNKIDKSKGILNKAGNFVVIPPHVPHFGWTGEEGAIIQISGMGPWKPLYE
jgi:quercetin dioxygenase-like cupin family protein